MFIVCLLMTGWGAAIYLSRKLFRDIFTPLSVYTSIWFACIILFRLRFVDYYELEPRTVLLIASSIVAFVSGCAAARGLFEARSEPSRIPQAAQLEPIIKILLILNFAGALIFAYRMSTTYGLGTYFSDPAVIRQDFDQWTHIGLLGLLLMLDYPLLICGSLHYLLTRKWRWFTVLGLLLILAQTFLKTDRGTLTIYVITCISLWISWNRLRSLNWRIVRSLGIVAALLLAYFLGVGFIYGKLVSKQTDVFNVRDFSVTSELGLILATPYVYATAPLPGFQEAIGDVDRLSWGTHTFFPIARILYSIGMLNYRPEGFTFDFYHVPVPVNAYTHLFAFYQDFGPAGVVLLPLILGYVETSLYLRMRARPDLFSLAASSAFTALNIFSVFLPLLTSLSFWYYLAVLFTISKFSHAPQRTLDFEADLATLRHTD